LEGPKKSTGPDEHTIVKVIGDILNTHVRQDFQTGGEEEGRPLVKNDCEGVGNEAQELREKKGRKPHRQESL